MYGKLRHILEIFNRYWEYGNEVYGATQAAGGAGCLQWGWEESWTCDGTTYVTGSGTASKAGYKAVRDAMRNVDITVQVRRLNLVWASCPCASSNVASSAKQL